MQTVVLRMLWIVAVSAQLGKHVYVEIEKTWDEAREYCQEHHTDLSPFSTQLERERLKNATAGTRRSFWIGLYKDVSLIQEEQQLWMWTGEEIAENLPLDEGEGDDGDDDEPADGETVTMVCKDDCSGRRLHGSTPEAKHPFFCFNLMVDDEVKKTWEEALEYCRETHTDLTSLTSKSEHYLALSEIQNNTITEWVWIGLRYLGDRWLWVNGDPMVYENWLEGDQEHQCPLRNRCGALTKEGHWENLNCSEKLNFICY